MFRPYRLTFFTSAFLLAFTIIIGVTLSAPFSAASDATDEIAITVPAACTLSGVGMDSHTETINPGQSNSSIGETTMTAFCNDNDGFAIYAIGYSNDTDGDNTLHSTTLATPTTISTGTLTSGNSQWAMKLATQTDPTPAYPISIENGYDQFHTVPDDYTVVAKRTAGTDAGSGALGSTFTTTYQAYISLSQPPDTYVGKVKYLLVHPNYVTPEALENAITVVFDGNGLTFPNGQTTNTVKYANVCQSTEYGYVGGLYSEVMTSNILPGGEQNGAYTDSEYILQTVTVPNADKVKVVVKYGTSSSAEMAIIKGIWDGNWDNWQKEWDDNSIYDKGNISGERTFIIDGDTVTIYGETWSTPTSGYDYGYYATIYPVYETEQPNTIMEEFSSECSIIPISGNYMETSTWKGAWNATIDDYPVKFSSEAEILSYIKQIEPILPGSILELSAYNPYLIAYNANGAQNESGMGFHHNYAGREQPTLLYEATPEDTVTLIAPNYKRDGYGFVGWSTDSNAINHLSTATLYGPTETITINQDIMNAADENRIITLYATWAQSSGNLQNWSGCANMNVGGVTALTDTRDNKTYAIAKLLDGNCWMVENLRLGGNSPMILSAEDTQSAGDLPAAVGDSFEYVVSYNETKQVSNMHEEALNTTVISGVRSNYAFGNIYSWPAAVNSTEYISSMYPDPVLPTSICPKGWALPSSSAYSELLELTDPSTNATLDVTSYPNNFIYAGLIGAGSLSWIIRQPYRFNATGFYMTSDANPGLYSDRAKVLAIAPGRAEIRTSDFESYGFGKGDGGSVRCYMQQD